MKKSLFVVAAVVAAVIFSGCVSTGSKKDAVSIAGDWKLLSAVSDGQPVMIPEGLSITFSADSEGMDNFMIYGFAGVNNYSGSASTADGKFRPGMIAVTMMAGPEPYASFERVFLSILNTADKARVSVENGNAVLQLSNADGKNTLTFTSMKLENTAWLLSAYNTGNAVSSLPADVKAPELSFNEKGAVAGFTGVNRLMGSYTVNAVERSVAFSALGMTKMGAISQAAASLENRFVELLSEASRYQLSGTTLRLLNAEGVTLLVFTKVI